MTAVTEGTPRVNQISFSYPLEPEGEDDNLKPVAARAPLPGAKFSKAFAYVTVPILRGTTEVATHTPTYSIDDIIDSIPDCREVLEDLILAIQAIA